VLFETGGTMNKANAAKLQHPYDCFPCCIVFTKSRNSKETDQSVFRRLKNFMPKRARENDMSGLRSLADWALGGGAGGDNNADGGGQGQALSEENPLSPEEMRAQRLAKMEALQRKQQQEKERQQQAQLEPMDVDSSEEEKPREEETTESPPQDKSPPVATPKPPPAPAEDKPKKAKKAKQDATPSEQTRKLQRRKELLLKKVLHIELAGSTTAASTRGSDASSSSSSASASIVQVDTGSTEISPQSVAEILATRLSMEQPSPGSASSQEQPPKLVMSYCGHSFKRAAQELKAMQQSTKKGKLNAELIEILEEIQTQVVSYAATCLIEPDLFPQMAKDAPLQLARCLLVSSSGVMTSLDGSTRSITVGANGSVTTSFYYSLCEELVQQDAAVLERTVAEMVRYLTKLLSKCDSVLDGGSAGDLSGAESSPVVLVTALTALSLHKGAAVAVTQLPSFLLPKAGTAEANEVVQPPRSQSGNLFQLLTNPSPPYRKRSGPALDRETIFGLALRLDIPRNNPAFSHTTVLHQTANAVESAQAVQRQQLRVHQEACYQFLTTLVKYKETRPRVMQWFTDALNVNVGASAMRPDPSKVSSSGLLLNMQVMLLKLCQPFMDKEDKQRLIDPGFVSSSEDHGGVYATTGDDAVTRLGDRDSAGDSTMTEAYNPKNTFIPQCFFFCARSLHFGIVPQLSLYENLLMTIHHIHREFSNANRDPRQEPRFAMYVGKQLSDEVALFQEDMVENTLRFCDLMAKFLYDLDDDVLRTMPEDFVSDACDVIQLIAKYKAKLLRGIEFRYVFKLVVKLLSAKYAKVRSIVEVNL
jgi:ubiquitin conjugation factor E4 B